MNAKPRDSEFARWRHWYRGFDEALAGLIALKVGQQYFVTVKSAQPYTQPVGKGKFVSFRQRNW